MLCYVLLPCKVAVHLSNCQRRKLRLREGKALVRGHPGREGQGHYMPDPKSRLKG